MSRIVLLCLLFFSSILVPSMIAAESGPGMVAVVDVRTQPGAERVIRAAHADGEISMVRLSGQPEAGEARLCLRFWDSSDRAGVQAALRDAGVEIVSDMGCGGGAVLNPDRWTLLRLPPPRQG